MFLFKSNAWLFFLTAVCVICFGSWETAFAQLNGAYTIDQTEATGGTNYASFRDAISDLNSLGIGGPVVFQVHGVTPYDVYNEDVGCSLGGIRSITGTSAANTITFEEFPGHEIKINSTSCSYVIHINGGDYISFDGFELNGASTRDCVRIDTDSNNISFTDITFGCSIPSSYAAFRVTASDDILIQDCSIDAGGAGYGVYATYSGSNASDNIKIINCDILNLRSRALYFERSDNVEIYYNDIAYTGDGIRFYSNSGSDQCEAPIIYNNMIHGSGSTGLALIYTPDAEVYFNSISNSGTSSAVGISIDSYNSLDVPAMVMNNAVDNNGGSDDVAIYIAATTDAPAEMDYNNWYDRDAVFGRLGSINYSDLSSWRTATGKDDNSLNVYPSYVSADDLHLKDYSICQGAGTPVTGITDDIDGDSRHASSPDIGADENLNPPTSCFTGTYTINGSAATDWPTGTNFNSFADVQAALEDCYLSGPTVFEVYDDGGTFMETVGGVGGLKRIHGSSPANTLIFREAAGENVVIDGDDYCIYVNDTDRGAEHIVFEGFTLTGFTQYGIYVINGDNITIRTCDITVESSGDYGIYFSGTADNYCDSILLYNNTIHGTMGTGIRLVNTPNAEIYFNSIFNINTSSGGYGIYSDSPNSTDVPAAIMNNAVDNNGGLNDVAIYIASNEEIPLQMDYNVWYDRDANFGYVGGEYFSDLALWRIDVRRDLNSVNSVPGFVSDTDLHIRDYSVCQNKGTAIAGITDDFEGSVRSATPDIGADENTNPPVPGFSGVYTINGASATNWPTGRNFNSFADAQAALENCYLAGPTIFDVYDDGGNYVETVGGSSGFKRIGGSSSTNTLTFREAAGENVLIDGDNYCIYVYDDGTNKDPQFMSFDGFSLTGFTDYGIYVYDGDYIYVSNHNITVNGGGDRGIYYYGTTGDYCKSAAIYNNMIHGDMNAGIYLLNTPDAEVYFNSIFNTYTSTGYGIYSDSPTASLVPASIMNNAVDNDGSTNDGAIYIASISEIPAVMDYNNWYDHDANFGAVGGIYYADMASWQLVTGKDEHSLAMNPSFVSGTDLHIQDYSVCQNTGFTITGITTDYDGDTRAASPDIGADENRNPPVVYSFSGTYTINGANPTDWPVGKNFTSFADAQTALEECYLTGPTVFEVYDDGGDFVETVGGSTGFKKITGISDVNTLTFREANGENVVIDGSSYCIYVYDNRGGSDSIYMMFDGFSLTSFTQYGVYIYDADYITISNMDITVTSGGDYGIYVNGTTGNYCDSTFIYNNMIHGQMAAGIYLNNAPNAEIYFNSIYNTYTSNGYGIYCNSPDSTNVPAAIMNNAVDNDGSDNYTAIYISRMSEMPLLMDYNLWYDRDTYFGRIWGVNYSSMIAWRSDTGQEAHTFGVDPQFIASSNLHISDTSPCRAAGTYIGFIPVDYDGETRRTPPDIGADEYYTSPATPTSTPAGTWYTRTPSPTPPPVPVSEKGVNLIVIVLLSAGLITAAGARLLK